MAGIAVVSIADGAQRIHLDLRLPRLALLPLLLHVRDFLRGLGLHRLPSRRRGEVRQVRFFFLESAGGTSEGLCPFKAYFELISRLFDVSIHILLLRSC